MEIPECKLPPSRFTRVAHLGIAPSDSSISFAQRGHIVVRLFSGDSAHRAVDEAVVTLSSARAARIDTIRLRPSSTGIYEAEANPATYGFLVRRIGYEAYRDSLTIRGTTADTIDLGLRTVCLMLE